MVTQKLARAESPSRELGAVELDTKRPGDAPAHREDFVVEALPFGIQLVAV